ncbi:MAG: IS630 family transposase [Gammaproteobacteria bacterium]|nr:IS630 family transposase [Gammaproteobacteria bacterium]
MSSIIRFGNEKLKKLNELLKIARKTGNLRLFRTTQALIFIGDQQYNFSFEQIAGLLFVSRKTIYNWLTKLICGGLKWLKNDPFNFATRGRKPRLNKEQKKELYNMVKEGPEKNGFMSGLWTCAMITHLIFLKFGVTYNSHYLGRMLKRMGLSYQKAKFVPAKCDEKEFLVKRKEWLEVTWPKLLKKAKEENAIILFGDEVSFAMWGSLGRTWGVIGEQPEVKTKGCRKGLKMFGAIGFNNGQFIFMESLAYSITPKLIKFLKEEGASDESLKQLEEQKNEKYANKESYLKALEEIIGKDKIKKKEEELLNLTETAGKFNGENYVKFLQKIIKETSSKVILIEDGAPYHGSKIVKEYVEKNSDKLYIERLPSFSPDFNPIEKLWKNTKRDATHCKYFETFEDLRISVVTAFEGYLHNTSKKLCNDKIARRSRLLNRKVDSLETKDSREFLLFNIGNR